MRYGVPTRSAKRSNYSRKSKYVAKPIKKAIKTAVKTNFNRKVLKVIKRHQETKIAAPLVISQQEIIPAQEGIPPTMIDLSQMFLAIDQGTGQGDRIGNKIYPQSVTVKGSVNISGTNGPALLKVIIFKDKKNQTTAAAGNLMDLFQLGDTNAPPSNRPMDMIRHFNTDRYIIHATRTFKLGQYTYGGATQNNDFSLQRFFNFNLSKHFKTIQYNDDVEPDSVELVKPSNLWMTFCVSYWDGTAITFDPANYPECEISFDALVTYKDA